VKLADMALVWAEPARWTLRLEGQSDWTPCPDGAAYDVTLSMSDAHFGKVAVVGASHFNEFRALAEAVSRISKRGHLAACRRTRTKPCTCGLEAARVALARLEAR
jgi:hypothetical protein